MKSHLNPSLCSACGGQCCKHMPGMYSPSDLKELTANHITEMLKSGKVAIDWWEGDPRPVKELSVTYYMRPRIVDEPAIKGSWGGVCVNHTDKGCTLEEKDKPSQCKSLIPNQTEKGEYRCDVSNKKYNKVNMVISWIPHQEILKQAMEAYRSN